MNSLDPDRNAPDLTDGRKSGEYRSRYPLSAWTQILVELFYLLFFLVLVAGIFIEFGRGIVKSQTSDAIQIIWYFEMPRDRTLLIWLTIALSGTVGGIAFAMKWLYHSVAKYQWNRDRWIWRFFVPILSGILALFLGFMVVSGIVPFFNRNSFDNFYVALGFGFFVGYFSDNVLAALNRFARRTFGTVDSPPDGGA